MFETRFDVNKNDCQNNFGYNNPLHTIVSFLFPLKMSENQKILAENGLI